MAKAATKRDKPDAVVVFHFDASGKCFIHAGDLVRSTLGKSKAAFLHSCLNHAARVIRKDCPELWHALAERPVHLRIGYGLEGTVNLMPYELTLNRCMLDFEKSAQKVRKLMVVGELERSLFHLCHGHFHISQAEIHSLGFYTSHRDILEATIEELSSHRDAFGMPQWLATLKQADDILLLERFWRWFGETEVAATILRIGSDLRPRFKSKIRATVDKEARKFTKKGCPDPEAAKKTITRFTNVFSDSGSVIVTYRLPDHITKVVRLCPSAIVDAMASEAACASVFHGDVRTDIIHDHGGFVARWVDRLKKCTKDPTLSLIRLELLSGDLHKVNTSLDKLRSRALSGKDDSEAVRLLYAALYYWQNGDKGVCRAVGLRANKILEDVLTERPATFPASRVNHSIFKGDGAWVHTSTTVPRGVNRDKIRARVIWAVNGRRKRPVPMEAEPDAARHNSVYFHAELPARSGWIHYCVQVSFDEGRKWLYEEFDDRSNGLLKFVADERGQRVLSFYADTLNLKLDQNMRPMRDDSGAYVCGTFDDIADQLEAIKAEGYSRIYPLGALQLGWAGEAGPDPSVFSIWDGKTVRPDMGGMEGLIRLKEKADSLDMKILLDVVSHFSRANHNYAYSLPAYICDSSGKLVRRAGWDGLSDEWFDSFMVNMRDFDNVKILSAVYTELACLGFGLRIDVGHGFDSVFPVDQRSSSPARLLGDVVTGGFEQIDLRGTWESSAPLLKICYDVQKAAPGASIVYSEQWHGNEARMIKSGTAPYNPFIKNLEFIRDGQNVNGPFGLNDTITYLNQVYHDCGGQTLSFFNTHDEESPPSNYQNMIWPAAAFLVFSSFGPLLYHISRLPGEELGSIRKRFDAAYTECWKHWTFNRMSHPWQAEAHAREELLAAYPLLRGFGAYLRGLYRFADEHPALTKGTITPLETNNGRIAAFIRSHKGLRFLLVFNFPNPSGEGQHAVAREFNFSLRTAGTGQPATGISFDETYELRVRYNNVEGKKRQGKREYWSGEELLTLGFGGVLPPVSSYVYELIYRDHAIHENPILYDSFQRYFRYGKADRIRHSFVAQAFIKACGLQGGSYQRFSHLFDVMVQWLLKHHGLSVSDLSILLREISENDMSMRHQIIDYLMRIAVNERNRFDNIICMSAADVLRSINVGPIVLVSPESKFSGSSGGLGLYTTDIADVLSEMGFQVIIVTPLYECNRQQIFDQYHPRYEGHSFCIQFPGFSDASHGSYPESHADVVNLYRTRLARRRHGKRSVMNVFYLENAKYFDRPYGGETAEDKLRRARVLSQGALEALRIYNVYPSVIQTNEWPSWLVAAYLYRWDIYRNDPHFTGTQVLSMMHNPHPSYTISLDEPNPTRRAYCCEVLGFDPQHDADMLFDKDSPGGCQISLTHMMLTTSPFIATVSRAMQERILVEPWVFKYGDLFRDKYENGRFLARRNGFNMGARQRFWFASKKSLLETYEYRDQRRLFFKYRKMKKVAKLNLQNDPCIRIEPDSDKVDHVIFGMLHRICPQKGFELLVDWKVYGEGPSRMIYYEPRRMDGGTVLEHFLTICPLAQFVICGRVEDSLDGRRYDQHFRRIANSPQFHRQMGYYPEGALPPSLYRNLYVGSQFFVMPSGGEVGEPCGISQQEAHAAGTPVIAHHQDGLTRTVSDPDFGDTHSPQNGIKFRGFRGDTLLGALLDAVHIYKTGHRCAYKDNNGSPKPLKYADLSFNAFRTDHRWIRLLHDYALMYAFIQNSPLPEHLHAAQLIAKSSSMPDDSPATAILRQGLTVADGVAELISALGCKIPSVQRAAAKALKKLCRSREVTHQGDIAEQLNYAAGSANCQISDVVRTCLDLLNSPNRTPA